MNVFKKIFGGVVGLLKKAFHEVQEEITEEQLGKAKSLVLEAQDKFLNNDKRREWAVARMKDLGVPEWAARMAIEGVLKILKKEGTIAIDSAISKIKN